MLRWICGPKRDEATGEGRRLHKNGNLSEGEHLEDPGIHRRIILKWIFKKWNRVAGTGLIRLRTVTGGRPL